MRNLSLLLSMGKKVLWLLSVLQGRNLEESHHNLINCSFMLQYINKFYLRKNDEKI